MVTVIYDESQRWQKKRRKKLGWNHHLSSVIVLNWSLVFFVIFFRNHSCIVLNHFFSGLTVRISSTSPIFFSSIIVIVVQMNTFMKALLNSRDNGDWWSPLTTNHILYIKANHAANHAAEIEIYSFYCFRHLVDSIHFCREGKSISKLLLESCNPSQWTLEYTGLILANIRLF